jgi:hypothetical protein
MYIYIYIYIYYASENKHINISIQYVLPNMFFWDQESRLKENVQIHICMFRDMLSFFSL